jgi:hypothetical protein
MPFVPAYVGFFPVLGPVVMTSDLAGQPTATITPSDGAVVFVVSGVNWQLWTLTAGTHAADSTHVLPLDYHATLNPKHWVLTASGVINDGNVLVDQTGHVLIDQFGNPISFS